MIETIKHGFWYLKTLVPGHHTEPLSLVHLHMYIKGLEHVICDVIIRHCINIVAAAILQFVTGVYKMMRFRSALRLSER